MGDCMGGVRSFLDFKTMIQASLEKNEEYLERVGRTATTQLKAYLIESNISDIGKISCPLGNWRMLEGSHDWYTNEADNDSYSFFLDTSGQRVWRLYSLRGVSDSDILVDKWIKNGRGLDYCWLSRSQMLSFEGKKDWLQRGIGIRFNDGLSKVGEGSGFSLKAWHGSKTALSGLSDLINEASNQYSIHSVRWQKKNNSQVTFLAEWYSNGKVTINKADSFDEVISIIDNVSLRYQDALIEASKIRDNSMGAFEVVFGKTIDIEGFKSAVEQGLGEMRLWLMQTEDVSGIKRFRGVDMHNWDQVLMTVSSDSAYITIPGKGCINAAPRIANLQGIDNAGRTNIFFNGDEVFV